MNKQNENIPLFDRAFNQQNEITNEKSNLTRVKNDKKIKAYLGKKRNGEETEKDNNKENYRERKDNCRLMIGRNFFNKFLIILLNSLIRKNGSNLYFERFPQKFILEATEKKNKDYLNKTLEDLLTEKELYSHEKDNKKALENFMHNFNVLKKLKSNDDNNNILEKSGLNKYLNLNYKELYEEYSNSEVHKNKLMKLRGQRAKEFEKFSESENFIKFFKK